MLIVTRHHVQHVQYGRAYEGGCRVVANIEKGMQGNIQEDILSGSGCVKVFKIEPILLFKNSSFPHLLLSSERDPITTRL